MRPLLRFLTPKQKPEDSDMAQTWIVIGLGNPGPRYEMTRHNIGQLVVDELAARRSTPFKSHKSNARVAETWLAPGSAKIIAAKPNTFMNVSGGPAAALAKFYSVPPERIIVVHDELDIPFDSLKLKTGGGHGGHNGVRDVAKALSTPEFIRVRVGIGRPPGSGDPAEWVLAPFPASERQELQLAVGDAADAVEAIIGDGLIAAQQKFHSPKA